MKRRSKRSCSLDACRGHFFLKAFNLIPATASSAAVKQEGRRLYQHHWQFIYRTLSTSLAGSIPAVAAITQARSSHSLEHGSRPFVEMRLERAPLSVLMVWLVLLGTMPLQSSAFFSSPPGFSLAKDALFEGITGNSDTQISLCHIRCMPSAAPRTVQSASSLLT